MTDQKKIEGLLRGLDYAQPTIRRRDAAYRGDTPLRYTADEVKGDLKNFSININRVAINSIAERMRPKRIMGTTHTEDISERAQALYEYSRLDRELQGAIIDALAVGVSYLSVWIDPEHAIPRVWVESAEHVWARRDHQGEVLEAVKRWYDVDEQGVVGTENVVYYGREEVVTYRRGANNQFEVVERTANPFGVVPIFPLVNEERIGDREGHSVLDDLAPLTDALSKVIADMIVTSEATARPRRYATGIPLEEEEDGFVADSDPHVRDWTDNRPVKTPFADGEDMFVTEATEAKFGTLPGSDLNGYKTAVSVLVSQIEAVSGLPGHILGVQTANPTSADALRAAEVSITARAESRIRALGYAIEDALRFMMAIDQNVDYSEVDVRIRWASPATRSAAQAADAVTKLFTIGVLDRDEARDAIGVDHL